MVVVQPLSFLSSSMMIKPDVAPETEENRELQPAPEDGIGGRIRATREARGFSQAGVAHRTKLADPAGKGVSRTVLVSYEQGKFRPGSREIRMICDALSITPTWLIYGADEAHRSAQVSMESVRKADFLAAVHLALAITVLRPHERSAFQSLVLSMAGRELGDRKLSMLLLMGKEIAASGFQALQAELGEEVMSGPVGDSLEEVMRRFDNGMHINLFNRLEFAEDDEGDMSIKGGWLYPEPKQ